MKVVGGALLELGYEMKVEVAGFGGFGVDEQSATADVIGELNESREDVLKHPGSKTRAFVVDSHAEPSEQSYRLGIAASAFPHTAGDCIGVELGHAPGVIGGDTVALVLGNDEYSRGAGGG
ncbi:MAG: hypothetical protein K0U76_01530 [Actinomycetia bacterium]|nr:hypothetical protein [Actinomycetes bacterium]MCH9700063.1 hypothetical protein [Actinomycetes bacterium]MCH9762561.1 hypothetical protein [Actinomycetes bacterium]